MDIYGFTPFVECEEMYKIILKLFCDGSLSNEYLQCMNGDGSVCGLDAVLGKTRVNCKMEAPVPRCRGCLGPGEVRLEDLCPGRQCCLGTRELGTRQTWDLTRLDSMAAEARALCDTIWRLDGGPDASKGGGVETDAGPSGSARTSLLSKARTVPRPNGLLRSRTVPPQGAPAAGSERGRGTPAASTGTDGGKGAAGGCSSGDRVPSGEDGRAVPLNPAQALVAVNRVMFERHGYRRMDRHGDPRWDISPAHLIALMCFPTSCSCRKPQCMTRSRLLLSCHVIATMHDKESAAAVLPRHCHVSQNSTTVFTGDPRLRFGYVPGV